MTRAADGATAVVEAAASIAAEAGTATVASNSSLDMMVERKRVEGTGERW